ncbi:MAG: hypothetical protein ACI4U0_01555 [Candidatus Aphodocola sp.]
MTKKIYELFYFCKNYLYLESLLKKMIIDNLNNNKQFKISFFDLKEKGELTFERRLNIFLSTVNTPFFDIVLESIEKTNKSLYYLLKIYKDNFNLLDKGIYYFNYSEKIGFNRNCFLYNNIVLPFGEEKTLDNPILNDEVEINDNVKTNIKELKL